MENELSRVVDVLPGLVWTALPDGRVDFVNRAWCDYTGGSLAQAGGQGWMAAIHPDDLAELLDRWQAILASHQPQDIVARVRRCDGTWRWFLLRVRALTDEAGVILGWCGMLVDIEDHRQADRDSHGMVSDFSAIADAIPASVLLMTPEGDIEYSNRQSQEFRGATLEQQREWKSADLIHPDELPAAIAEWERCVRTGELFEMEFRARRADGVYRWFHVRSRPMKDAEGRIARWCTLDVDIDDRKRSEALLASTLAELAASEDRLRAIIDTVPGFVWRAAPDGGVEFLNQRWCDFTGISLEDSLGIGWTSSIHPDDAAPLATYWQALLEAGQPGSFEARLRRFDGTYRWFLIRAVPLLDEAGRVVKWYGQNTDIDDRKRAEMLLAGEKYLLGLIAGGSPLAQALTSLCELVQASMEGALCAIVLIDPRHTRSLEEVSLRLRLQLGAAPDVPDNLLEDTNGQPLEPEASPIALSATSGEPVISTDLIAEARWDAWRAAALSHGVRACWSTPIRSGRGNMMGIFSLLLREPKIPEPAHHNLIAQFTHLASIAIERARNEAALTQSEAFLARTQRLTLTGTVAWRVNTDEILWSEELYRIYEFDSPVTLTHDLINTRIHPEDIPAHDEMLRRQRSDARDFESEHRLLMPDGRVKFLHLVAHATRDEEGGLEYISAVQDVTQHRLSEEALGKVRSELTHVARVASLGTLTASIAHEVNQPLSGIITNANTCLRMLAANPPNVDGARETARRTIRDGNRASDVIKRLRALFAKKKVATEPVDLNEAAREVVAMLLGELQRNGVTLHPGFADDLPPVMGDRVQLQQVILNLILNASDAMSGIGDRPRRMAIRTGRDENNHVRLDVLDTGAGFDPQDADALFNAFFTTKSDGMGIGLSVSRSIIEGHDGRLWAAANDGPGATFSFSIPCLPEEIAAAESGTLADSNRITESS
ncbi:PAS domain S-box protein [Rhodanobacter glycinis]|uniref:histidine kinase n=2 Tax=Rhodanobacter glycinis TaxID=582702 RepID=A0A502C393_9GAMM|nr:PAS domain S-box protein [Rhodanobacter glycinis]TPG46116.1 PAS domain S-box protein [Rhodanobacter glycinis]